MADYNEPYLTLRFSDINTDVRPSDLPPDIWSGGQNVRFRDGSTIKCNGHEAVFGTPTTAPVSVYPVGYGGVYYWVYAGLTKIYVTDGTTHTDITPGAPSGTVSAGLDYAWNGGLINNILVLNNTLEAPIWWTGSPSNPMTALTGWPANHLCDSLRVYKNYLFALNVYDGTSDFPDLVMWSHPAAAGTIPSSWDDTDPTKDAGTYELSDTRGGIIDGAQLGDAFIIYKQNSCYIVQYIGGQYIFQFRRLFPDIGALSANCIASFGRRHLVLTGDDLIYHDAVSIKSVLSGRNKKILFNNLDSDNYSRSFMAPFHKRKEIWLFYPTSGNTLADKILIWNYERDTIGFRDTAGVRHANAGIIDTGASVTWDTDSDFWDTDTTFWDEAEFVPSDSSLLLADYTNTKLLEGGKTNTFAGTAFQSYAVRDSMPLLDRHNVKFLKAIYPHMTSSAGGTVKIRIGTQMNVTDSIDWGAEQDFVIGTDTKVDCLRKGRFFSYQVRSDMDIDWEHHSVDFEIEIAERW